MSLKAEIGSFSLPAYAKINLYLDITGKRADGYHTLNSVMQRISLCDNVAASVKKGGGITVFCDDSSIPCDERNIAFKAARAFFAETGISAEAAISIEKHIPVMAGLGGSSADGAAVLTGLNRLFGNVLEQRRLEKIGAKLGADVPFCIRGGTAVCKGIGDEMSCVKGLDKNCRFVVVKPEFSCDTKRAYEMFDDKPLQSKDFGKFLTALDKGKISEIGNGLYNVFETLYNDERIERIKRQLIGLGAAGACLSGSGSAVFGIFDDEKSADNAVLKLPYRCKFVAGAVV